MTSKPTYFRLLDLQNGGRVMGTGYNSSSKLLLKESFLSYISLDFDLNMEEDSSHWIKFQAKTIEELCNIWSIEIQASNIPFDPVFP